MTDPQMIILSVDGFGVLCFIAAKTGTLKGSLSLSLKLVPPWERQAPEPKTANGNVRPADDGKVPLREAS